MMYVTQKRRYVTVISPRIFYKQTPIPSKDFDMLADILTKQNELIIDKLQELIDLLKSEVE